MAQQQLPKVLLDFAMYIDGVGKIGTVPSVKLPDLEKITEEHVAAGMAGAIDIDMAAVEKLEAMITMAELDKETLKLFGAPNGEEKAFTFRGATKGRGPVVPVVVNMQGRIKKHPLFNAERRKIPEIELTVSVLSIKVIMGGETVIDIDIEAGRLVVGGVDQREGVNNALGI